MSIKNVNSNRDRDIGHRDNNKERALELIEKWLRELEKESKGKK